ncbi:MAG TPA: sugar diacid recognition domain-containing protein [Planococcus sp. (in: firmicutes)]|nr:sugar diacid recognition domain-containing protein [Planococcus sp. (in: firmicutes)]
MLTKQLAEEIVRQTMIRLNRNLNVMDTNGMILASGDIERVERIHEGAAHVAKTGESLWISSSNLAEWKGSKPGVNMPILFQQQLVGIIGITGEPDDLKEIATLVQLTTEMMVHQSLTTSNIEWRRKMNELIFEDLTSGKALTPASKERLLELKFIDRSSYTTLLVEYKHLPSTSRRIIEQLEDQFQTQSTLIGHSQISELFILIADIDSSKLEKVLSELLHFMQKAGPFRIGVGLPVQTIDDIRSTYLNAKDALQFGKPDHQLIYFEDVEIISLLKRNSVSTLDQFTGRVLSGLSEMHRKTLRAYYNCDKMATEAADFLQIHRHTLSYRLKKVEELTGLNPNLFNDAVILHLALLMDD